MVKPVSQIIFFSLVVILPLVRDFAPMRGGGAVSLSSLIDVLRSCRETILQEELVVIRHLEVGEPGPCKTD